MSMIHLWMCSMMTLGSSLGINCPVVVLPPIILLFSPKAALLILISSFLARRIPCFYLLAISSFSPTVYALLLVLFLPGFLLPSLPLPTFPFPPSFPFFPLPLFFPPFPFPSLPLYYFFSILLSLFFLSLFLPLPVPPFPLLLYSSLFPWFCGTVASYFYVGR